MDEHPKGQIVLVLGILGLACCGPFGIAAWMIGNKAHSEIAAGQYAETSSVRIGRILGMVATALTVGGLIIFLVSLLVYILAAGR